MKTEDVLNKRLQQRVGKTNPFAVPEGYFEQLPQRVMALIPEKEANDVPEEKQIAKKRPLLKMMWKYAVAACCGGLICISAFYLYDTKEAQVAENSVTVTGHGVNNTYEDAVMDCAMMDNADIYACLMSNE